MNDKRKSRPLVAQETGQAETVAGKTHDSYVHFTTSPAQRQAIYKSLLAIAFEVNRIASIILFAGAETDADRENSSSTKSGDYNSGRP